MERMIFDFPLNAEQKKWKEETSKKLLKNKYVKDLMKMENVDERYISNHIGKISDWTTCLDKCEHCAGLDFCTQSLPGHFLNLSFDDGILMQEMKKCRYKVKRDENRGQQKMFLAMDFPEHLLDVRIGNIDLSKETNLYKSTVSKLIKCMHSEDKGLYLYGQPGVGKTYLAIAAANYFAQQNKTVAFVNVPKLISDLKMLFSDNVALDAKLKSIKRANVLVLDDIGGESVTAWSRDEILLPLLDERMEKKRITFFTSNYSIDELEERLKQTSNKMKEPMAACRLLDRIKALSSVTFVEGVSRRQ